MSSPILPQTWLRDPLFALKTQRGKAGLTEQEQLMAAGRWVGFVKAKAEETEMSLKEELSSVTRRVSESQRHRLLTIARKFVEGQACCRENLPALDLDQFIDPFARGEFDEIIWNTSKPGMTGRFWPWVKDACAAAEAAAAADAELVLKTEAEEAARAAERAFEEAERETEVAAQQAELSHQTAQEAKKSASMSVLKKLREAHCKTLQLHCQGKSAALQSIWASAEEAAIRRQERSETEGECAGLLELKGEKSKTFPNVPWARQLPALSRVVFIDADAYSSKDSVAESFLEDAEAAMDIVGDRGCVIVVTSAPSLAQSGRAVLAELGMKGNAE